MIKIERYSVMNFENAVRGMRNAMNSWDKSDSYMTYIENPETENTAPFAFFMGEADLELAQKLIKAGSDHRKFMRQIFVSLDITAPLYWWKEFDTYKVGTVANSCSTMHKIHAKKFTLSDFSHERLVPLALEDLEGTIKILEALREKYLETKNKEYWDSIIQLLPSSYNQMRTCTLNYENLLNMCHARSEHKLSEWREFCGVIRKLPYAEELIYGKNKVVQDF